MKIILINPRSKNSNEILQKCFVPVNLTYLASSLLTNGYQVEIIDANALCLSDREIVKRVKVSEPDVVGISLLSEILPSIFRLVNSIKCSYPKAKIVGGGPHVNALPEEVLREFEEIDYLLVGEAEESIVQLCKALENKIDLKRVKGLYYREEGRIVNNGLAKFPDIDSLNQPAKDLLRDEYERKRYYMILTRYRPVDTLITSRGCPFHCRFCCNARKEYRARSPENVLEEIITLYSRGIRSFDIADANFTLDRARAIAIFDLIKKEKLNISFRIKSRCDFIDEELVRKAKEAGAYLISLGMESGSQEILDRMNKGTKIEDNVRACKIVMDEGLKLNTGWIIGFPGETMETIEETLKLIVKIKPTTANINLLVPYPGTEVYEEAKIERRLVGDWSVKNGLVPWVKLPWVSSYSELLKIVQWVRNKVYYRPYYIFSFVKESLVNANFHLARYMVQEVCKSLRVFSK